jgi:phage terminase Nu1 subunit (DNA packaging protein)
MMPENVTQAAFARQRGVSRKTVTDWKSKGLLSMTPDGLVKVEESEWLLADRPQTYRGGTSKPPPTQSAADPTSEKTVAVRERPAAAPGAPVETAAILSQSPAKIAEAMGWTTAEAQRVKEIYLALIRRQEYEVSQGKLVEIEAVAVQVESEYAVVRERLLGVPGKLAAKLVGLERAEIDAALFAEVSEALNELHDPGDRSGGLGGTR